VRLAETSVDLAVALAVAGSKTEQTLSPNLIALGEVGLAGEVRTVPGVRRRLGEASRLGFKYAVVPRGSLELADSTPLKRSDQPERGEPGRVVSLAGRTEAVSFEGMTVIEVDSLTQALRIAFTAS
jgi:DNA repair protein RadA/Sms